MEDLSALVGRLDGLIASLSAAQRKQLTQEIARTLRSSQARRIKENKNPDGSAMEPRKGGIRARMNGDGRLRAQKGAIRRGAMFRRIHRVKHLKAKADASGVDVGFNGMVSRVARIHQYGLRARVGKDGPEVQYPKRELLGLTDDELKFVENAVISHLADNL